MIYNGDPEDDPKNRNKPGSDHISWSHLVNEWANTHCSPGESGGAEGPNQIIVGDDFRDLLFRQADEENLPSAKVKIAGAVVVYDPSESWYRFA